ncbi:hypothetical protein HDU85_004731 [Gaertneriomyces sp. JEL0708]|nr:hypothetical protein HDU85_004731 [Gaertneriomyces sp. JEL0708]
MRPLAAAETLKRKGSLDDNAQSKRVRCADAAGQGDGLLAWATSQGADVSNLAIMKADLEDGAHAARTVISTKAIPPGSPIAQIPVHLVLSESNALASPFGQALWSHASLQTLAQDGRDPYAPALILLAAFLVWERFEQSDSFWAPYLESLPVKYQLPLWWTDEEVDVLLSGTNLEYVVQERAKLLKRGLAIVSEVCGEMFTHHSLTWENFLWAYSAISSRAFPRSRPAPSASVSKDSAADDTTSAASELCLYPILDMLNHRRAERIEWRLTDENVTFVALDGFAGGEEVFNNYGAKGNENLLANYGFVLENNQEDYVKIALNVSDEDPLAERKLKALAKAQPNRLVYLLFAGDDETQLASDLLAVTRLLVVNRDELSEVEHDSTLLSTPMAPRNEVATLGALWELLSAKRAAVESGQQRIESATDLTGERRRLATIYRAGQLRIFRHSLSLVRTALLTYLSSALKQYYDTTASPSKLFLSTSSEYLSTSFRIKVNELVASLPEDIAEYLDEDTILCFALIWESQNPGTYHRILSMFDIETTSEQKEEIEEHYEEIVQPILEALPEVFTPEVFTKERFVWAARILDVNGLNVPKGVIDGIAGWHIIMLPPYSKT